MIAETCSEKDAYGGEESIKVVLLDIEGTICPISFVKDVLFPYFLNTLPVHLSQDWDSPDLAPYISAYPPPHNANPTALLTHTRSLMSQDSKAPYLKALQGHLFTQGYASGELKCDLFPDVRGSMERWVSEGRKVMIYSSGSVHAQKLLISGTGEKGIWGGRVPGADSNNTTRPKEGDLSHLITAHWDIINAGPKQESSSYTTITTSSRSQKLVDDTVEAKNWLFISDRVEEVRAAKISGMRAVVVVREGNEALPEGVKGVEDVVESFEGL